MAKEFDTSTKLPNSFDGAESRVERANSAPKLPEKIGVNWWRSFERDDGWMAGNYEVQFYVGDQLADAVTFRMAESEATATS